MAEKSKPKPFYPQFSYTPRWKDNRSRGADAFRVDLRDLPEGRRIKAFHECTAMALPAKQPATDLQQQIDNALGQGQARIEYCERLVEKHLIAIHGLSMVAENGEDVIEINTFALLQQHAQDAVIEIAERLMQGPGEEELKNS